MCKFGEYIEIKDFTFIALEIKNKYNVITLLLEFKMIVNIHFPS